MTYEMFKEFNNNMVKKFEITGSAEKCSTLWVWVISGEKCHNFFEYGWLEKGIFQLLEEVYKVYPLEI